MVPPNRIRYVPGTPPDEACYCFETNIYNYTHHFTVDRELDWSSFGKLLLKLPRLEAITWLFFETPFPAIIKEVLQRRPRVKLYIENMSIGYRTDLENIHNATLAILKSLIGISSIHTVKVETKYEEPVIMRWLKDVLLSSKNLEVLHLTLPRNNNGNIEWHCDGLGAYDLCVEDSERLDSLTELVYESRLPDETENQLIPMSFFNWSKIRHLELRGPSLSRYVKYFQTQDVRFETLLLENVLREELGIKHIRPIHPRNRTLWCRSIEIP